MLAAATSQADPVCLEFDNRWEALTMPHISTQFFCVDPLPIFEADASGYSPVNAWWLCEVSRIIYKEGKGPLRNHYFGKAGLKEMDFFDEKGIQCALIEPKGPTKRFSILVFRGTSDVSDWLKNLDVELIDLAEKGRVHQGFYKALMKVWPKLEAKLAKLEGPTYYCGHSLGAALAIVAAAQAETKPRGVYAYGCPRIGDPELAKSLEPVAIYRIVNHLDVVTTVPPTVKFLDYTHAGTLCYIAHDNSLHVDPNEVFVTEDRAREERTLDKEVDRREVYYPPEPMSDHAPANYSAHLERQLPGNKD